jgi:hypothetical protein
VKHKDLRSYVYTSMEIDPNIARQIIERFLEYSIFAGRRGYVYVLVKNVMHGYIQASIMWFNHVTNILRNLGHEHCFANN